MKFYGGLGLCLVGFIFFIFFSKYSGEQIPNPFIWYVSSIMVMIVGFLLLLLEYSSVLSTFKKANQNEVSSLKKRGKKIKVDLSRCQVMFNSFVEEREINASYRVKGFNALGDDRRNVEHIKINKAVLLYEQEIDGKMQKFYSQTIPIDKMTLNILMDRQKQTYIYVDRNDNTDYYFDIEFLKKE